MFSRRTFSMTGMGLLLVLMLTACGVSQPSGVPSEDAINTSVAATIDAQSQATALPPATAEPAVPTHVPTEAPVPSDTPASSLLSVAFVSPDKNAYTWNESLSVPIQLTTSGDVQEAIVSPDGTRVVLIRSTDWIAYSLDIVNSDGTDLRTLVLPSSFDALPRPAESVSSAPSQVNWLPGTHLLAMTTRVAYDGPGYQLGENLFLIDSDTGSMQALLTIESMWSWNYTYSPDGTKIAISYPEGIDIYHADGSGLAAHVLDYPFVDTASEYAWVASPLWEADSNHLVAVVPPQDPWITPLADSSVWRLSADGTAGELLFSTPMTYWPSGSAAVAPDLSKILFLVPDETTEDNRYILRLVNIDGTGMVDYISGDIHGAPDWSTDNSKFYYFDNENGAFVGQPGSAPVSVPDFDQVRSVKWIDADRFIGVSGPDGGWQLLMGNTASPASVIYSTSSGEDQIVFTINR